MRKRGDKVERKLPDERDKRETHYAQRARLHGTKYDEFHRPSVQLLLNLVYTYDVVRAWVARRLEPYALSPGAFNALLIIGHYGRAGCPMCEVGELLLVSRPNVTGLVDLLVRRGLVERVEDAADRRVRLVRLTRAGERFLDELLPAYYASVRELFAGMSDKEKRLLSELLTKLRHVVLRSAKDGTKRSSKGSKVIA